MTVKNAEPVDAAPASPKENSPKADEAEIRKHEVARARAMQPKPVESQPKRKKGGRVSWTQRYELGPGDTLNFGLHGQPSWRN